MQEYDPDIEVNLFDSLDSGNCTYETTRVARWFRDDKVTAQQLLDTVIERDPPLIRYAFRAVKEAERQRALRQQVVEIKRRRMSDRVFFGIILFAVAVVIYLILQG